MTRHFRSILLGVAAAALMPCAAALGGTATSSFAVSATVQSACTVSASALAFGTYLASSATPTDTTSTLTVTCTNGLTYTVALDGGTNTATVNARAMTLGGAHNLTYALYTSSAHTTIWGDGTLSTATMAGTGIGSAQSLTVYGRIPAAQFQNSGSYTDTVNVTVSY